MKLQRHLRRVRLLGLILFSTAVGFASAQNITTYNYDRAISGINPRETILTPTNVNVATFGQLFDDEIDGQAYAQPLYLSNVAIPNKGTHNVVYIATCHDSVTRSMPTIAAIRSG